MQNLQLEIKQLIIDALNLEDISIHDIANDEMLFGDEDGLNLDSIDALELGLAIKKRFNVIIDGDDPNVRQHFANVSSLSAYISTQQSAAA
ncbi:phosphopantetheine-binding protein [Agarivorans sp. QJM3NY_33]|uniref:phosphopantetheine-binding protein n=1 Tax=Agarivorans sp. QJM3NY_33 TaxID=3421432 RepID=UPI003D7E8F2D